MPLPSTVEELATWIELEYRRKPGSMVFAAMFADGNSATGGSDWNFGAVISLEDCDPEHLFAEIGMTISFRRRETILQRRAGYGALAVSVLLRYCFNLPSDSPPGLGLRRVGVHSLPNNAATHKLAKRLGFRLEGKQRWCRVVDVANGKVGNGQTLRKGDVSGSPGIDAHYFSMCWDEWEGHGRDVVQHILACGLRCGAKL
ncbi:hypothetical protein SCHPADRAFT_693821 [Schizopora paradoxa]|uniref:N-acetyltransferase domain-containing protein n=1 Tax=Schizopora paradoxa TaxID=27342 RepID=A0A0H2R9W1_9AGAM|nr:hypothetical protein SCHPADRAFT_693821 [Schizopora paradoxa]